jgi:hypothetical protein
MQPQVPFALRFKRAYANLPLVRATFGWFGAENPWPLIG